MLFRRAPDEGPRPAWLAGYDQRSWNAWAAALRAELARAGVECDVRFEEGVVVLRGEGRKDQRLGLGNLAQLCLATPRREWRTIIARHLELTLRMLERSGDVLDQLASDFGRAREVLKVRLFSSDVPNQENMVVRSPAHGLVAALVYDLPDSVASVRRDHAAAWGTPTDELFRIALGNVLEEEPPDHTTVPLGEGGVIHSLSGSSHFTATRALALEKHLQQIPAMGVLVCVPHRHAVLFHPIQDARALHAMRVMVPAAQGMFQAGPGSVSPHLYWWTDGRLVFQPTEVQGGRVAIDPTEEFLFQVLHPLRSQSGG